MRLLFVFLLLLGSEALAEDVYVQGYMRSDGTYVKGHYRSAPNATINDNFSTKGNINPYTGKRGWIDREPNNLNLNNSLPNYHTQSKAPSFNCNENQVAPPHKSLPQPVYDTSHQEMSTFDWVWGVFIACLVWGCVHYLVYVPYKHLTEFVANPVNYYSKHGASQFIANVIMGLGVAAAWIVVAQYIVNR